MIVGTGSGALLAVALRMGIELKHIEFIINEMPPTIFGGSVLLYFVPRAIRYLTSVP